MQRISLGQPNVAIDPRAFIEPTFVQGRVHSDSKYVLAVKVHQIRQVEAERRVSAGVFTYIVAIEHDHRVAEYSIKLHCNASAQVCRRKIKHAPVPANAGFGIIAAQRFRAMVWKFRSVFEGKLNGPVMGQIDRSPRLVVEVQIRDRHKFGSFGERSSSRRRPKCEVLRGIARVAEMKAPAEIQQQPLTWRGRDVMIVAVLRFLGRA